MSGRAELLLLGTARERSDRGGTGGDGLGDIIKVACTDFALMFGGGVAARLSREFGLLKRNIGRHLTGLVAARQLEHRVIERVEAGQGNELELVAHRAKLVLEFGDGGVVELA